MQSIISKKCKIKKEEMLDKYSTLYDNTAVTKEIGYFIVCQKLLKSAFTCLKHFAADFEGCNKALQVIIVSPVVQFEGWLLQGFPPQLHHHH